MVTITWNWAGVTSSRSVRSSPILAMVPHPQGAGDTRRFDHLLDARQLLGQRAGATLLAFDIGLTRGSGSASDGFANFCDRDLDLVTAPSGRPPLQRAIAQRFSALAPL